MKRIFDFLLALLAMGLLTPVMFGIALVIKLTSPGPVIYWSNRVGQHNRIFAMPKFRTMRIDTPEVATNLLTDPDRFLTPIGSFLRKASLDEIPQLWSILRGDMSFVGPRPVIPSEDLVALRAQHGVDQLVPGLTGWAQIHGRDELSLEEKLRLEVEYLQQHSFLFDLKILIATFPKVMRCEGITH